MPKRRTVPEVHQFSLRLESYTHIILYYLYIYIHILLKKWGASSARNLVARGGQADQRRLNSMSQDDDLVGERNCKKGRMKCWLLWPRVTFFTQYRPPKVLDNRCSMAPTLPHSISSGAGSPWSSSPGLSQLPNEGRSRFWRLWLFWLVCISWNLLNKTCARRDSSYH
jgi:hypothetical protein